MATRAGDFYQKRPLGDPAETHFADGPLAG